MENTLFIKKNSRHNTDPIIPLFWQIQLSQNRVSFLLEKYYTGIVDIDTFNKVQEMMKRNKRTAGRKKAVVEYLLTEKLFCGKCGAAMTGCSGTSKTGAAHHYYVCTAQKKKMCTKKAVRQLWIENLVLECVIKLVQDMDLMEFIADNTYQYYLAQNTDTSYTKSLQKALVQTSVKPNMHIVILILLPSCRSP